MGRRYENEKVRPDRRPLTHHRRLQDRHVDQWRDALLVRVDDTLHLIRDLGLERFIRGGRARLALGVDLNQQRVLILDIRPREVDHG